MRKVFADDAEHIITWLAHRVQRPQEKINHALVLGGKQGIGKDTALEPVKHAIGPWNFLEVSPQHMLGRFNGFLKSVILRVSEARDLGEVNRFEFYDHMKAYTAAPPDVLRVDEKNLREHSVLNVSASSSPPTTRRTASILPADDRRHYVAWSDLTQGRLRRRVTGTSSGAGTRAAARCDVAAYLAELDLSRLRPEGAAAEDAGLLGHRRCQPRAGGCRARRRPRPLGNPDATTLIRIANEAAGDFETWIKDRKNRRAIPHRLEKCGYVPVRNDRRRWALEDQRQAPGRLRQEHPIGGSTA